MSLAHFDVFSSVLTSADVYCTRIVKMTARNLVYVWKVPSCLLVVMAMYHNRRMCGSCAAESADLRDHM